MSDLLDIVHKLPDEVIEAFIHWCIYEWMLPNVIEILKEIGLEQHALTLSDTPSFAIFEAVYNAVTEIYSKELNVLADTKMAGQDIDTDTPRIRLLHKGHLFTFYLIGAMRFATDWRETDKQSNMYLRGMKLNAGMGAGCPRDKIDIVASKKLHELCLLYGVDISAL